MRHVLMRVLQSGAASLRARLRGLWLLPLFVSLVLGSAWAQPSKPPANNLNLTAKVCEYPEKCFKSAKERQNWGKAHDCQFLEDVCEEPGARFDRGGTGKGKVAEKPADKDAGVFGTFWGSISDAAKGVTGGLEFAWSFIKGFWEGVKTQVADLAHVIANPVEVAQGLIDLGKAFVKDPVGTIKLIGEMLGKEAIDTLHKATRCGAWDLGKVLGQYISPAVMLKVATKLTRYTGDISKAIKETRHEVGCASFVADTPVWAGGGTSTIQRIRIGQTVFSRDDRLWTQTPQRVTNTFNRVAPGYREIVTEFETYRLTDEHPVWVQGKGWTEAKSLTNDDVVATLKGDVRVRENIAIGKPVRVFNFAVDKTPNYFVGNDGLWVHNAKCEIVPGGLAAHEAAGGHLIARHVGKSESDLFARLAAEPRIPSASSFTNRALAEFSISSALDANRSTIQSFLSGSGSRLVIKHVMPSPVGISVARSSRSASSASKVTVVLDRDPLLPWGYRITTGYPEP